MKSIVQRFSVAILTLALAVTMFPLPAFAEDGEMQQQEAPKAKRTIMLYDCGTDLETDAQMASYNLRQILRANFSSDEDVRFIIMTGGTNQWHLEEEYLAFPEEVYIPDNAVEKRDPKDREKWIVSDNNKGEISNVYNQIWEAKGADDPVYGGENHGKMVLLDGDGVLGDGDSAKRSKIDPNDYVDEDGFRSFDSSKEGDYEWMNKPEVLKAFINFCVGYAPAEKYDLILWDHGQGPIAGFCNNEQEPANGFETMSVDMIMDALSDNAVTNMADDDPANDGKFDFLDFDACLMNSVEVDMAIADYMDYLIASADVEPGYGQNYEYWLNTLGQNPDTDTYKLGKQIVDDFIAFYDKESGDGSSQEGTLAVIDMNRLMTKKHQGKTFLDLMTQLTETLKEDMLSVKYYDEFRSFKSSINYFKMGYYDLGQLLSQLAYAFEDADLQDLTPDGKINDTNRYTDIACALLGFMNDPEVMYARSTMGIHTDAHFYRDQNRKMQFGEQPTSGMQFAFLPKETPSERFGSYHQYMGYIIDKIQADHPERASFFKTHLNTMEAYGLANSVGIAITEMISEGTDKSKIDYDALKAHWKIKDEYGDSAWTAVQDYMESFGGQEPAKAWVESLIPHMIDEVVLKDQIQVQQEESPEGNLYRITFNDIWKQAIDSVQMNLIAELPATKAFLKKKKYADYTESIRGSTGELVIGSMQGSEVIEVDPEKDGYEAAVEWLHTKGSTWKLGEPEEKWYALKDAEGKLSAATVEIQKKEIDVPTGYFTKELRQNDNGKLKPQIVCNIVYLVFTKEAGEWELTEIDLQKDGGGWRAIPIEEYVGDVDVQPLLEIQGDFDSCYVPISESTIKINHDTLKNISLEYLDLADIPDIADTDGDKKAVHNTVTVTNIYGYKLDITDNVLGTRADNPLSVKGRTATLKYKTLKKKSVTLPAGKVITFSNKGAGSKTYRLISAKKGRKNFRKNFRMNPRTGKVTIRKGLKKGTYKLKIKVSAAGDEQYKPSAAQKVTSKIKIR